MKLLFNFYVKRTVCRQDFDAKFNLTYHNGAPVVDISLRVFKGSVFNLDTNIVLIICEGNTVKTCEQEPKIFRVSLAWFLTDMVSK